MEWLNTGLSPQTITMLEEQLENWGALAFLSLFLLEMLRLALKKRLTLNILGDSLANAFTFGFFIVFTYGLLAASYVSIFYWAYLNFALIEIAVTPLTVALLIVLCDFAYYWEHRFSHRVGLAWATHSVHHSSPHFNISVAYRFGPMDGVWPLMFHLPLVVIGFDPLVVLACEAFVQFYQTILHTEVIRKLPRPIEAIFNTPSHHRVHHGSNDAYLDKNYGGIFIIWDRLFGTFAEEKEPVTFGLTRPINSNNPLTVWFHGFVRLARRSFQSGSISEWLHSLIAPPEWQPGDKRLGPQGWFVPAAMTLLITLWIGSTPGVAGDGEFGFDSEADTVELVNDETVDAAVTDDERALLMDAVQNYYEHYVAGDTESLFNNFAEDALFHYRMDFGQYYGTNEFSFRADDAGAFDDSYMAGYEATGADYTIKGLELTEGGATAHVYLTETYAWDGYDGTMKAYERLHITLIDGYPVVTRFDSDQVYR